MKKMITALVALTTLFALPVLAADRHSWQVGNDSYHVYYDDLNMQTASGRAEMLARVQRAAAKLCAGGTRNDEAACEGDVLNQLRHRPGGTALTVALAERNAAHLATR